MKKTFESTIIFIIFSLLLWGGWAEGKNVPDKPIARLGKGTISKITYSPDGKLLAVAGGLGIWLYDTNNLTEMGFLQGPPVSHIVFSPDSKTLASASGWEDSTVRLWDVVGKKEIAVLEGCIGPVAFSPSGKVLASGGRNGVHLWDVAAQKEVAFLEVHTSTSSIAFSSDGKMFASGYNGAVLLWGEIPGSVSVEIQSKRALTWGETKRTALLQNYPNPFNPETWIPFELANGSDVILRIYDAKGNLVREIPLGRKSAGSYIRKSEAIYWNGKNELGERVASGVYFYTLQTGDFKKTKKMTVAK